MVSPAEIMRDMYDAWRRGDVVTATDGMAPSILYTFHIPTSIHPLGGPCHGKAETLDRLGKIAEEFDVISFEPGPIVADDKRAAIKVTIHYRNKATGEPLDLTFAHFVEFEDGKMVRCDEYHDLDVVKDYSMRAGFI